MAKSRIVKDSAEHEPRQCSCKRYPLKHRNEPLNSVCPTLDCVLSRENAFYDFYTYTRTNGPLHASPQHVRNRRSANHNQWYLATFYFTLWYQYSPQRIYTTNVSAIPTFPAGKKLAIVRNHNLKDSDLFSSMQSFEAS